MLLIILLIFLALAFGGIGYHLLWLLALVALVVLLVSYSRGSRF